MLDKDKLYIIIYISIKNIDDSDVPAYISEMTHNIKYDFDDSVKFFVIPTKEKKTYFEFFNGEMLKKLESEDIQSLIDKLKTFIKD